MCASVLSEWGAAHARAHVPATSCVSPGPLATGVESVMPAAACTHRTARRWVCMLSEQHRRQRKVIMKHNLWKARACMVFVQHPLRRFHRCDSSPNNVMATGLRQYDVQLCTKGASLTLKLRSYACPNVTASLWMRAQVRCMAMRCTHHKLSADRRGLAEVARFTHSSHGKRHQLICPHAVWCSARF